MKAVFADMDGVLNSAGFLRNVEHPEELPPGGSFAWWARMVDPAAVRCLNRLTEATGAVIVWSSSWRLHFTDETAAEFLKSVRVTATCIGRTPSKMSLQTRAAEVAMWLRDHPEVDAFVVLDDDKVDLAPFSGLPQGVVIRTDWEEGLTEADVDAAIEALGRRRKARKARRSE